MVDVDALQIATVVRPDSTVHVELSHMGIGTIAKVYAFVTVDGGAAHVKFETPQSISYSLVSGDTVTLATFFEDIAKILRGE